MIALTLLLALQDSTFAGEWDTTFGEMTLKVDGLTVSGSYVVKGETSTIAGEVKGRRLTFTYRESGAEGEGWFELAADGRSFSGQWRERGTEAWQPWVGKRREKKPPTFDGVWNSTFGKMRLHQDGDRVSGIYSYGDGSTIEGTVKDGRLAFRYREGVMEGEGWFELAKDAGSFRGEWRPKAGGDWKSWTGTRVAPVAGRQWLVVIEARWEGSLADREYSFGDMLRTFFARTPNVEVRHRTFSDEGSLGRWCKETAFLAEPVVLAVATHGTPEGLVVGGRTIGAKGIAENLRHTRNLTLLHFSSCLIMKDKLAVEIVKSLGRDCRFPISGYTTSVDWAASAVIEFLYFDLVLSRGMKPAEAAASVKKMMPIAGDARVPEAPFESAGFRIISPDEVK